MEKLKAFVKETVEKEALIFYGIEYVKENKQNILRVIIDAKKGVEIDDCVKIAELVGAYLDKDDPIDEPYALEVTSPGAEKELRNMEEVENAIGKYVYIETMDQKYVGDLQKVLDGVLTLKIKNKPVEISYADVNFIRLSVKF